MTNKSPAMILWDADGVLFETFGADGSFLWSRTIAADLGIPNSVLSLLFGEPWDAVLRGQAQAESVVARVFADQNIACDPATFIAYWLQNDARENEKVSSFLTRFPASIATNQTLVRAQMFEERFRGRVQHIYASAHLGLMKPEPKFFAFIEKDLALAPAQLCLIDDTPANVTAAQARGWQAHLFQNSQTLEIFMDALV